MSYCRQAAGIKFSNNFSPPLQDFVLIDSKDK